MHKKLFKTKFLWYVVEFLSHFQPFKKRMKIVKLYITSKNND